jgi:hypothetical protein
VSDQLTALCTEYERISAAALTNFLTPVGGRRGKQKAIRYDASLKRATRYIAQLKKLEGRILALGGEVPNKKPAQAVGQSRPARPAPTPAPTPVIAGPPAPCDMTIEALKAEDAQREVERRAAGALSISARHRSIKAELGRRSAIATTAARRSAAAKKGAKTRAERKAAGLGPKPRSRFEEMFREPPGGWTDADRV